FYVGVGAHDYGRPVENLDVDRFNGTPEMKALLDLDGTVPSRMDSAEFGTRVREELALWQGIARKHNISAE
ncbi:MAG: hypothetical protein J0626_07230, partial [Rhodospirillaceae bacterium]|nr:hypothetical protein [Rhodospirillaceae bacterium]